MTMRARGGEVFATVTTDGHQFDPSVAGLSGGGFVLAWTSGASVMARAFASDGAAETGEIALNQGAAVSYEPAVTGLRGGGWAAIWSEDRGQADDLRMRLFSADHAGQPPRSTGSADHDDASGTIAGLANGRIVSAYVRFQPEPSFNSGAFSSLYAAGGVAVHEARMVPPTPSTLADSLDVAALAGGRYAIGWSATFGTSDTLALAQMFDADGSRSGALVRVADGAEGAQTGVSLAGVTGQRFAVAWEEDGGIVTRVFDRTGAPVSEPLRAGGPGTSSFGPDAVGLGDGTYIVVWGAEAVAGDAGAIVGMRVGSDGTRIGGTFRIERDGGFQDLPTVASLGDGDFVVGWQSGEGQDGDGYGVFFRRMQAARLGTDGDDEERLRPDVGDWYMALAGDDSIEGRGGRDSLEGGPGGDTLKGGPGGDTLAGQGGGDRLDGGGGKDRLVGGGGNDSIMGGGKADRASGGGGGDEIAGGAGRDSLDGGSGRDRLEGNAGSDRLDGGGGDDVLAGGPGNDRLFGGPGVDRFDFRAGTVGASGIGRDRIGDYEPGEIVDLRGHGLRLRDIAVRDSGDDTVLRIDGIGQIVLVGADGIDVDALLV